MGAFALAEIWNIVDSALLILDFIGASLSVSRGDAALRADV
jgi:hypothetical protein